LNNIRIYPIINFARTDVETIMKKEPIATDGESVGIIIDAKENLTEIQDIIDFLVEDNGTE